MKRHAALFVPAAALTAALLLAAPVAEAHCDSVDGPVVVDAKAALAKGDVAPVLKWITAAQEPAVREAFRRTLAVRTLGADAREVADTALFETLVRLHRESEGAPYTGLKQGGTQAAFIGILDPALTTGTVDNFAQLVGEHAAAKVKEKFAVALEAKKKAEASPADGRTYVAAYVDLMHSTQAMVEAVHSSPEAHGETHGSAAKAPAHTCD